MGKGGRQGSLKVRFPNGYFQIQLKQHQEAKNEAFGHYPTLSKGAMVIESYSNGQLCIYVHPCPRCIVLDLQSLRYVHLDCVHFQFSEDALPDGRQRRVGQAECWDRQWVGFSWTDSNSIKVTLTGQENKSLGQSPLLQPPKVYEGIILFIWRVECN